jgi:quercetin dioxygenase-like cupin family protein
MTRRDDPASILLRRLMGDDPADVERFDDNEEEAAALLDALTETLPVRHPSPSARNRLLRTVRLSRFAQPVADLFHVSLERARAYLSSLTEGSAWHTLIEGVGLMHLEGGEAVAGADVGFVQVAPDLAFPAHLHGGEERNVVLEGSLIEADGTIFRAGDTFTHPPGSQHLFRSGPEGVVFAVVVWDVDFGDALSVH